jgi:hypothetical protein
LPHCQPARKQSLEKSEFVAAMKRRASCISSEIPFYAGGKIQTSPADSSGHTLPLAAVRHFTKVSHLLKGMCLEKSTSSSLRGSLAKPNSPDSALRNDRMKALRIIRRKYYHSTRHNYHLQLFVTIGSIKIPFVSLLPIARMNVKTFFTIITSLIDFSKRL